MLTARYCSLDVNGNVRPFSKMLEAEAEPEDAGVETEIKTQRDSA